jgi:hypothetical protein
MAKKTKLSTYSSLSDQILSTHIIKYVKLITRPIDYLFDKIHLNFSNWIALLIFETLIACLIFATWELLKIPVKSGGRIWVLWGNILTAICVSLVDKNLSGFLHVLDLYSDKWIQRNKEDFLQWIHKTFDIKRQITISFIFSFSIFPFTILFFDQTIGLKANRIGAIVLFINMWIIGNGFYWIAFLPISAKEIFKSSNLDGYFDPKNTVWINALSDIYEYAAISVSIIGVLALVSLIPSQLPMIRYISLGWLFLILALIAIPFLYAKSYLSKLIRYSRYSTMSIIQMNIAKMTQTKCHLILRKHDARTAKESIKSELSKDDIDKLLSIYDLTKHSQSSLLDLSSSLKFINSLLLPIGSFIVINYSEITSIIKNALDFLFS